MVGRSNVWLSMAWTLLKVRLLHVWFALSYSRNGQKALKLHMHASLQLTRGGQQSKAAAHVSIAAAVSASERPITVKRRAAITSTVATTIPTTVQ